MKFQEENFKILRFKKPGWLSFIWFTFPRVLFPSLKKRGKGRFFRQDCCETSEQIPLIPPFSKGEAVLVIRLLRGFGQELARHSFYRGTVAVLILFTAGCDPVINIGGTFFPGWMAAILIGSALTVAIRYVFVFTRLEPHVGPLALIYTSLGLLLSVMSWLILYRS